MNNKALKNEGYENYDRQKVELLAPAGNFEALRAAVENGANAVYLGGKVFNARASAVNFDLSELEKAVAYAHERLVKVYITVNILIADSEFPDLIQYIYNLYSIGVDAVILQDLGTASFISDVLPELEIHASTQMTQNNSFGVNLLQKMGFSRVILARETSAQEMKVISGKTSLKLETFVHGALCISYSGQCFMSSFIGARSGNRGRCAQPCRMVYKLVDQHGQDLLDDGKKGAHLLSPRDLNLIEELDRLKEAGISSLKIEGRMKRPEYVATVVRLYRQALDKAEEGADELIDERNRYELTQIFNRDFTTGYLEGYKGTGMMSFTRPNNRGTMLGRITDVKGSRFKIKLDNELSIGDGIEIWTGKGREGLTVNTIFNESGSKKIEAASAGESVILEYAGRLNKGDRVFKTHDEELIEKARYSFREGKETRKRPLKMYVRGSIGKKLELEAQEGKSKVIVCSEMAAEEAHKRPLTEEFLEKQLSRLGTTPFYLDDLKVCIEGNLMIPVSEINEMRRAAVEELLSYNQKKITVSPQEYEIRVNHWHNDLQIRLQTAVRKGRPGELSELPEEYKVASAVSNYELFKSALKAGAKRIILGGEHWRTRSYVSISQLKQAVSAAMSEGVQLIWRLPRISNQAQSETLFEQLKEASGWENRPTVMAANLAEIEMLGLIDGSWEFETDHFIHVFNQPTLLWLLGKGAKKAAYSLELSLNQISEISLKNKTELTVFGDMETMITEFCLPEAVLNNCKSQDQKEIKACSGGSCSMPCSKGPYFIQDRLNYAFPIETDRECRMHIFNSRRLNLLTELDKIADTGIRSIRLELVRAEPPQAEKTIKIFKDVWENREASLQDVTKTGDYMKKLESLFPEGFTKGHFYRGVLS